MASAGDLEGAGDLEPVVDLVTPPMCTFFNVGDFDSAGDLCDIAGDFDIALGVEPAGEGAILLRSTLFAT